MSTKLTLALSFSLSTFVTACGTVQPDEIEPSGDDLADVMDSNSDLDGNGYDDSMQSFVIAYTDDFDAVLFVKPGAQLPGGWADGQALSLFGYGSGQYSSDENGWVDAFMSMSPVYDSNGNLAWYGVGGIRDGNYEVTCGTDETALGDLDGWCLPGADETEYDVHGLLMTVKDGQEGCWRESKHWAFEVQDGWVDTLVTRLSNPDPNCY